MSVKRFDSSVHRIKILVALFQWLSLLLLLRVSIRVLVLSTVRVPVHVKYSKFSLLCFSNGL